MLPAQRRREHPHATTNASGQYSITGVTAEQIIIEASGGGAVSSRSANITGNTTIDFSL